MSIYFGKPHQERMAGIFLLLFVALASLGQTPPATPQKAPAKSGATTAATQPEQTQKKWPKEYKKDGNRLVLYQPQIEDWKDQMKLEGRVAIQFAPAQAKSPLFGALRFEAKTKTNPNNRTVYMYDWQITDLRFSDKTAPPQMRDLAESLLPKHPVTVDLDAILAHLEVGKTTGREVQVSTEPPKIFYSTEPALLLITQGDPVLVDVKGTGLKFVLNTNWDVFVDEASQYYLLNKDYWMMSKSLKGPWLGTQQLPASFSKLPAEERWDRVKKAVSPAGKPPAVLPIVFYYPKPAELILFDGPPKFAPVGQTKLLYASNTESDLFFHQGDRYFYYLTAGRWFLSADPLGGQWEPASDKLPTDFGQIPPDHPKGRVLASVRGTREAQEAVLQASIPQTVTLKRVAPDVTVEYAGGKPEFVAVPGTSVSYAKNTQYDVFLVGGKYYLCYQAAWFVSASPTGPWEPADNVPQEIYQVPPESPKHNVTYVQVYESSPTTVTYGYTPGYVGMYIAWGCVVLGSGYYYPPYYYWGPYPYPWYYPYPYYGYGIGAVYNPYTGTYARGGYVYGPYGGYGQWSAYNPRTGAYGHGAGWYGPYDAGRWSSTYNPRTGVYSQSYAYTNYEEAWGERYVQKGDKWAQSGWYANEEGAVRGVRTSEGTGGIGYVTDDSRGFVAKGQENLYAGKDGEVYKRDENGNWYHYDDNNWNPVSQDNVAQKKQEISERRGTEGTTKAQSGERGQRQPPTQTGQQTTTGLAQQRTETGTARADRGQQPSTTPSTRTPSTSDRETLSGLNRDASARQMGAQRSEQYRNWGSSAPRGSSGGARVGGGRPRRR